MTMYTTFSVAGPPRDVPLLVRLRILFGGFLNQFGWFFFGFGLIFVWLFTVDSDLTGWYVFSGELETASGRITASRETNISSNGTPVWQYTYTFTSPDGRTLQNTSYRTGGGDRTGQDVRVEYPQGRPETSRIEGMDRAAVGLFGLMPVVFPLVGLCFMAAGMRKAVEGMRLLRDGLPAVGTLIAKDATNTKINEQTVYRLTFEFTAGDGQKYIAFAKTHQPAKLQDEAEEPLLYDPMNPARAIMLDELPGSPRVDEYGQVRCSAPLLALGVLLIPAATVIGHTTYAILRWGLR